MLTEFITAIVRYRALVVCGFCALFLLAIFCVKTAHIDAIPDIGENQQIVYTKWQGRSPQDIEEQITYPLSVLLQGISGVKEVRGTSAFGFSTIYLIFADDVDFYWSRTRILEKLATVKDVIPDDAITQLGADATGLGQVFWYTVENIPDAASPKSLAELRSIQDFYIKYLLSTAAGVSEVASIGGFVKEYQIDVDPKKLFAYDIHFSNIINAVKNSNIDVGAEVIESGAREFIVRGKGFFASLADIEDVVIAVKNGTPIHVKDVANVGIGAAFRRGVLDKNGKETVGGVVTMRFGANPQEVIDAVKEKLVEVRRGLPADVRIVPFYDRTELIAATINTVYTALGQEIIITIVVILLFLLHIRSSLLVSLTLPFGVGISFILMRIFGIDSNVMSLAGLVIAIGSMVDLGIIITENIYARLALDKSNASDSNSKTKHIIAAAREVTPAIITAVLTTIITFLPVFALEGSEGKLFAPLAWTKTLAMFGALLAAIILIPALAKYLLRGRLVKSRASIIVKVHRYLLGKVLRFRVVFLLSLLPLIIVGMWAYKGLDKEFMPALNEGDLLYMPVTTPDVSISKARELLSYTNHILNAHPLVEYAVGKLGRSDSAIDPAPIAMIETVVKLVPQAQWPAGDTIYDIMQELDQKLQIPGLVNSWDFPIQTRVGMISTGIKTQVGVKIFGDDMRKLEELAHQVGGELEQIAGAYGVYAERITGKPYIELTIKRAAAARFGINAATINSTLQTAVGGIPIGKFYDGRERYPIRIRYKKELRDRIEELKRVLVPSPLGQHVPMEQLADLKIVTGAAAIQSENGMLRALVLLNVKNRGLVSFVDEAKQRIDERITLPAGFALTWAGEYENQVRANNRLLLLIPLVLLINLLIIFIGVRNWRYAGIVFSAVPIAFIGGMLLLWLGDYRLSVAVWVGFIALSGITVDSGLVMIAYLRKACADGNPQTASDFHACILEAGSRRVRPLLMTTATTVAALLPVMWARSTGSEVMQPMAVPILGGMALGVLNLYIVPVLFSFVRFKAKRV
ncbi:MAG: CusA/CzcA family heavy metal efflux RND transporter [Pseudomonadota bacterium]|nr:CusA/CzcA family heavy metal efflux RND transporter [Pseudomonadota bacterium]